jgi:predicted Zn finger-like uncharacterized protein
MPEIVQCSECQRKLKVPDSLLGKRVKCPTCGTTFTAGGDAPPAPAPAPTPARRPREEEEYEEKPARPRRGRDEDEEDEDEYEERPRRRRRRRRRFGGGQSHRGGTVLTLGILSIALGLCCPLLGIGLGIGAMSMANADLPKMDGGEMDPSGMGSTRAGQICGIIGLVLSILNAILGVIIAVSNQH